MNKKSSYTAKKPSACGLIDYSDEENTVWQTLFQRQKPLVKQYACQEYLHGHELLQLSAVANPQLPEVTAKLQQATGWSVAAVPALISFDRFFKLLANRQFPAATFIRRAEELDYLQEPDIFHEIYGHCPMLTEQVYADFMQKFGLLGLEAKHEEQVMLARLYWFTVEFGLIRSNGALKAYGAGILSSIGETPYAITSDIPQRKAFDLATVLRTPYRIDIFQTIYFVIDSYQQLYELFEGDIMADIRQAIELGLFAPTYPEAVQKN